MISATNEQLFQGIVSYFTGSKTPVICDNVPGLPSFEAPRYMGSWFEIMHVTGESFQPDAWKCN